MDHDEDSLHLSRSHNPFKAIIEPIIDKIEMIEEHSTELKYDCHRKNQQAVMVCDIIKNWLFLNRLQRIVVEKVLYYAIINNEN